MKFFNGFILLFGLIFFVGGKPSGANLSTREIITHMFDSIKKIKTQRFDLKSTERINGNHFSFAESKIKINESPKKIYFHNPKRGVELLWVEGENKGEVVVRSKSFPMNLDLDPYGSIIRKDQHHTIFDLGFPHIGITIANTIISAPKEFDKHFKSAGTIIWNHKECYQIVIDYPSYKYIEYIVKKGETVTSIARKLNTSDYKIRYKNNLSSYFGSIAEGKKLLIPTPYSNKGIFYIEKKTMLPVCVKVYDEEGLFESYEYSNVQINVPFAANEFSKNFKEYGF